MNTKILKIGTFAIIAILAFGCKKYSVMQPNDKMPIQPTHSIEQLISEFGTQNGVMFPVRPNSGTAGLYSVDIIPSVEDYGSDIIIVGRVISDDSQGNYYKSIAIQDLENPKYAIKISIDAAGIGAWYPKGSVVSIRCNGLAIGKYADMFQLGICFFNNNADAAKKGYEPGRMPMPLFKSVTEVYDLADHNVVVDTMTIAQVRQAATDRSLHSRIICIKNAYFTGEGVNFGTTLTPLSESEKIFAPSTNGIGFPQSRAIRDGAGNTNWTVIATSEYSRFCNVKLPSPEYVGNITAIVGWYRDKSGNVGSVQLTICSLEDLELYSTDDGSKWKP